MPTTLTDFGTDIGVVFGPTGVADLDPHLNLVSGPINLAYAIARRLCTPRGSLPYDTEYGYALRLLVNESLTPAAVGAARAAIADECEKDERVISAHAEVAFVAATNSLTVTIRLETNAGPFRLVLAVTASAVAVIAAG